MQPHTPWKRLLLCAALTQLAFACEVDDSTGDEEAVELDEDRIVGGVNTNISTVPWQISLQTTGGFHFCGGSIIDDEWILTAAHCVQGSSAASMRIEAGVTLLSASGQVRNVAQIYVAPGYDGDTTNGKDVALLRLSSPLSLNANVAVVELATEADAASFAPGDTGLVSGWGTLSAGGPSPNNLQSVSVPIVSNAQAAAAYGASNVTADQLAAGALGVGGVDACQGDSGGPLVVSSPSGPLLAGVVSWGNGCGLPNFPGMYARVASFTSWIDATMGNTGGGGGGGEASCEGRCGTFTAGAACQCDAACSQYGDCCADEAALCDAPQPSPTSCVQKCGQNAGSCWCDAACAQYGDCCADKVAICG